MHRFIQYAVLFGVSIALQIFLFDNLQLSIYLHPFVYVVFILLLPMEIPGYFLLLLAAVTGITMDFFSGVPGVHTIATVGAAFCRPTLLRLFVGKEIIGDGGIPNVRRIGAGKFFRYALVFVVIHATVFFALETLSTIGILFTGLRIGISTACNLAVIWAVQRLFGQGIK